MYNLTKIFPSFFTGLKLRPPCIRIEATDCWPKAHAVGERRQRLASSGPSGTEVLGRAGVGTSVVVILILQKMTRTVYNNGRVSSVLTLADVMLICFCIIVRRCTLVRSYHLLSTKMLIYIK